MAHTAFEITPDDVESVLRSYKHRIINARGLSIDGLATDLFDEVDVGRVEKAALDSSTDFDHQVQGAYDEIKDILVELGVLEF